jgi:hypothetical protein
MFERVPNSPLTTTPPGRPPPALSDVTRGVDAPHFGVQLLEALQHQADEFRAQSEALKRQQAKSHKLLA